MYRIFALSETGWLYQLSSQGWVIGDGTNFTSVEEARNILGTCIIPPFSDSTVEMDAYIASVDLDGLIMQTWEFCASCNESEG
jgi:hypothetical protein